MRYITHFLIITILITSVLLRFQPVRIAHALTITVNSTIDPGDGTCATTEYTLREAIAAASGGCCALPL